MMDARNAGNTCAARNDITIGSARKSRGGQESDTVPHIARFQVATQPLSVAIAVSCVEKYIGNT